MSSLGPLFIPRKDALNVPKVKDNPELEQYLRDLSQRIHVNELAMQRWANSVPRLAAVLGTGGTVTISSTGISTLPLSSAVNSYFANIVNTTAAEFVVPQDGWYTISGMVGWDTSTLPAGDHAGTVETIVYVNGSPISTSGDFPEILTSVPLISCAVDWTPITLTKVFSRNDTIQLRGQNNIFTSTAGNTSVKASVLTCALDFLGPTPSSVQ